MSKLIHFFPGDLRRHNLNVHEGKLPAEDVDEKPDTKKILEFPDLITDISKQNIDSEIPI